LKKKNYTLYLITDADTKPKTIIFSSVSIWVISSIIGLLLLSFLIFTLILYPKATRYDEMVLENQEMIHDRLRLTEILSDYNRILDMDKYIRSVLGTDLAIPSLDSVNHQGLDTLQQPINSYSDRSVHISYVDNLPVYPPVDGYITQGFIDDHFFPSENHWGIDVAASVGAPIKAAASGIVVFSNWINHLGNTIMIYHSDGYFSIYGHNQRNIVKAHQKVERGQVIGFVGNTGVSDGPHLHLEIWKNGIPIDPEKVIYSYRQSNISKTNYK